MNHKYLFGMLFLTAIGASHCFAAEPLLPAEKIDAAVIASIPAYQDKQATILAHIDLTTPFATHSQWTLVVAQDPIPRPDSLPSDDDEHGPIAVCFVKALEPKCTERYDDKTASFQEYSTTYELMEDKVVYLGGGNTQPLLWLKTCSARSGDGACDIRAMLYDYDQKQDRFQPVFTYDTGGSNENQNVRYMDTDPLRGDVVLYYPTGKAPYTYWVEVYKRGASGKYSRILKYRGHTGYGDGNPLPVIYSEMPAILQHLGFWKAGDPLPIPPDTDCAQPSLRHGEEWCQTQLGWSP